MNNVLDKYIEDTVVSKLSNVFNLGGTTNDNIIADKFLGKYVIIRTYSAGVHFGVLEYYDSKTKDVVLTEARRLFRWYNHFTLSQIAKEIDEDKVSDWMLSTAIEAIKLTEIEIILVSEKSERVLRTMRTHDI